MAESFSERKIHKLLDDAEIPYLQEKTMPGLKSNTGNPLRFDFAIYNNAEDLEDPDRVDHPAFLLELQGEQHYKQKFQTAEQFTRQKSHDKKKVNYCRAKGIPLIQIPYTDFQSMSLDSVLEQAHYFD